jgi:LacI family transcriptional regulator
MADVAAAAGVSQTTASLVLSGRGPELRISDAVQQRVHAVSDEMGYRPNILSIGLSKGTTRTLGFVSDTVATSQLAGDMIKGALEEARQRGYMLFIGESEGDAGTEQQLLDAMLDRRVDGIILASMFTRVRSIPKSLEDVPSVLLNALSRESTAVPAVIPDEYTAGRAAAQLLLDAGHREIHLIGAGPDEHAVPPGTVAGRERLAGILDAFTECGIGPASGRLFDSWLPEDGRRATTELLERGRDIGAMICFNDRLAFGAYQVLHSAGLDVPRDVSIVAFDNAPLAEWLQPGLSTFAVPHYELGQRSVQLLLESIEAGRGNGTPVATAGPVHRLEMPLLARGSVTTARPATTSSSR